MYKRQIQYSSSGPGQIPEHVPVGLPAYLLSCFLRYCTTVVLQYDLLDPKTKVHRVRCPVPMELCPLDITSYTTGMIAYIRYCTMDPGNFQWDVDRKPDGRSLSDSPESGEDSSRCSCWIRLLIGRNSCSRSCTDKLGGGWERKYSERRRATATTATAKLLGYDCCGLLLFFWRRKCSPHKRTYAKWPRDYSGGKGRKYSQLCVAWSRMDSELHNA